MRKWIVPVAVAGGVLVGALTMGVVAKVSDDPTTGAQGAQAQTPTTVDTGGGGSGATVLRHVSVGGVGNVSGTPDTLTIGLGVRTQAQTAGAALDEANTKARALIDTLEKAGVAAVDIVTTNVSVWPQYDNSGRQVTGYEASNSVNAKLRDLSKAGEVIDAAAGAVGDAITLGGLSFGIDDTSALYAQARELAVKQAHTQADQLAKAAGGSLGPVISIEENAQQVPMPMYAAAADSAGGAASVPLQPGSQTISLSVQVTYELRV
jgi:uncharacterized protein